MCITHNSCGRLRFSAGARYVLLNEGSVGVFILYTRGSTYSTCSSGPSGARGSGIEMNRASFIIRYVYVVAHFALHSARALYKYGIAVSTSPSKPPTQATLEQQATATVRCRIETGRT